MRRAAAIGCCVLTLLAASAARSGAQEAGKPDTPVLDAPPISPAPPLTPAPWPGTPLSPAKLLPPVPETEHGRWYYQGLAYGSDALVHPVRLILNGGFGTLQFDNRTNKFSEVDFEKGWRNLWRDVGSPIRTIEVNGWNRFLQAEVIPFKVSKEGAQYWPNYTLHLVGGGMSHAMMREWYEQNGYAHPAIFAGATLGVYHVINEVVEAEARNEPSTDPIADLLIFDPLGAWLFSHESVNRFFSRRLHLRDWSAQPSIDPTTGAVENNGQDFSIKWNVPRSDRWSLFYFFGNHGEVGFSYRRPNGSAFSAAAGIRAGRLVDLGNGVQTVDLIPSGGLFYDRNGSLMFSLTSARTSRYGLRLNAYPGLLRFGSWSPGLFLLRSRDGDTVFGIHLRQVPMGLAGHF